MVPMAPSSTIWQVALPWMPILCSSAAVDRRCARPGCRRLVHQELRHDEQRDALAAGRRVGQAGQHQVHDVVGHVVLAGD
jgi:hypothetical protein